MEIETLFTISKWEILTHLAAGKYSPLELSRKINTSMANVSQQLRLLEFAGLVRKEKLSQREAGKPRTLYFRAKDVSHLVLLANRVAEKRLLTLTEHHKAIIRIWMIEDTSAHYFVERFYRKIEHLLDQLKAILIDSSRPDIIAYLIADSKDLDKKVQDTQIKDTKGETRNIIVKVLTEKDVGSAKLLAERIGQLSVIHDPEGKFMHKTREV